MSTLHHSNPPFDEVVSPEDTVGSIFDVALILLRRRALIFKTTAVAILLAAIIGFVLKPTYVATSTILPPREQQSSLNALLGQLGPLASLSGASSLMKNPADTYVAMITSRTIADSVIAQFHLRELYGASRMDDVRRRFQAQVTAEAGKDGLIHVSVEDTDPARASDLTNALIASLYRMTSTLAVTEAGQRRLFFDQQLQSEKAALSNAEEDFRNTQQKTGVIQLSGQAEQIIRSVAGIRAQIASLRVELQAMSTYATEQNPDVARLQQRIAALREQLASAESDQRSQTGNVQMPVSAVPAAGLEYSRKLREVTYHTALLNLLTEEEEGARIDEAKSAPTIQIIDRAVPPDRKSGPHRLLIIASAAIIGMCFGCFLAFLAEVIARKKNSRNFTARMKEVSSSLGRP